MAMQSTESKSRLWGTYVAIMIPLGVAINYVGGLLNSALGGPLYLDSIGTAVVAAVMGPWVGAISGLLFNVVSALMGGNMMSALFGICNIGTGLIVGYMTKWGFFEKWWQVLIVANVLVSFWNAATGSPIASVVYGGVDGSAGTSVSIAALQAIGADLVTAGFIARMPINLIDKGIAVLIAWIVYKRLPENIKNFNKKK
ncbi:MAG: ECF transporter S component [Oscillospiraceae bacterium]|jgi:energy-coupling factor transport system substrate-specific component|nr:ECF transporter S component [Oscillospiraceae bacterium]MBR0451092.1 ECF transporter S component [Oscillospiraceae bacterium]MDO5137472.1 ECF transporter S component [Oscillospiraceae bacterium]